MALSSARRLFGGTPRITHTSSACGPPKSLRAELSAILERIHFRYGEAIRDYKGDTSTVPDVESELSRCLRFEAREETDKRRRTLSVPMILLLLLLGAAALFFGFRSFLFAQQLRDFGDALDDTAGIHVTDISRSGGAFSVRGLRDPLAPGVPDVAKSIDIDPERVTYAMQPFQSLEPEIVAARAAALFGQPGNVLFDVEGTTLRVSGDAPASWRRQLEDRFAGLAGVDRLDLTGLSSSDLQALRARVSQLDGRKFHFVDDDAFVDGDEDALRAHARDLRDVAVRAERAGRSLAVTITGSTDAIGTAQTNAELAMRRTAVAYDVLTAGGVEARVLPNEARIATDEEPRVDLTQRYVKIDLQLKQDGGQ